MPSVVGQITKGAVFAALVGMADVGNNKWDATAAPGAGDDSADGYIVGSIWADITHRTVYVCTDNAAGAAVWVQILTGGGAGAAGAAGMPGIDGADGLDGFPTPGPAGATGAGGATGATGADGRMGPPGMDGAEGFDSFVPGPSSPGAAGEAGVAGPQGIPGIGLDGQDGQDAFPISGLPGAAGAAGASITGQMGPPGMDGSDGLDGIPIPGPVGATGAAGAAGASITGQMGPPGCDGQDGLDGWPIPAHGTPTSHDIRITCAVYLTPVSDTVPKWISPPLPLSTIISAEIKSYTVCGATSQVIDICKQTAANKDTNTCATIWSTHGNCLSLTNTHYQAETTTFDVTAIAEGDRLCFFSHVLGTGLTVAYITITIRPT